MNWKPGDLIKKGIDAAKDAVSEVSDIAGTIGGSVAGAIKNSPLGLITAVKKQIEDGVNPVGITQAEYSKVLNLFAALIPFRGKMVDRLFQSGVKTAQRMPFPSLVIAYHDRFVSDSFLVKEGFSPSDLNQSRREYIQKNINHPDHAAGAAAAAGGTMTIAGATFTVAQITAIIVAVAGAVGALGAIAKVGLDKVPSESSVNGEPIEFSYTDDEDLIDYSSTKTAGLSTTQILVMLFIFAGVALGSKLYKSK